MNLRARLLWALCWLLGRLPLAWLRGIGATAGWLAWRCNSRAARICRRNLLACAPALDIAPGATERWVGQVLREAGAAVAELPWIWTSSPQRWRRAIRDIDGYEHLEAVAGKPLLVVAPHLGAFELLNAWLCAERPMHVLYRPPRQAWLEDLLCTARRRAGSLPVRARREALRSIVRALAQGGAVGILPDQQPKAGEGEFAPFFGVEAYTMTLLSRLAGRADGGVILAGCLRCAGGFVIRLRRPQAPITDVATLNREVEALVRLAPEQYQWAYKRFSIRPAGEAGSFYG